MSNHSAIYFSGKKLADGKGLCGAGRLTEARILAIQSFYNQNILRNVGNPKMIKQETMAILGHYGSPPDHSKCPVDSWCKFNNDLAHGM